MPRYFFNYPVNGRCQEDDTGEEFSTLGQVRSQAVRASPLVANTKCTKVAITREIDAICDFRHEVGSRTAAIC